MSRSLRALKTIHRTYRRDTAELAAHNLGLGALAYLCFGVFAGALEITYYPARLPWLILVVLPQVAAGATVWLARPALLRRDWLLPACVILGAFVALSLNVYEILAHVAPEMVALASICLMTGLPLLFPWGFRGQVIVAGSALLGFAGTLFVAPTGAVPWPYALLTLTGGACVSLIGAHYLDLHRFAIFRETVLKEEEGEVARALLAIAGDLNASLDAPAVAGRLTQSVRQALGSTWSVLLLWDGHDHVFRVAEMDAGPLSPPENLRNLEYAPRAFPVMDRVMAGGLVAIEAIADADPVTASLMRRYRVHALMLTAVMRGERLLGIIAAGLKQPGAFSGRARALLHGISQQAAIALENVQLVADLRRADRIKSEFVATMSHELRTPLNVILGYNELLLDDTFGKLLPDQRTTLERIQASSADLLDLITATLNVNRLQAGRSAVQLEEIRLPGLLDELQGQLDRLPRKPGVQLEWSCPPELPKVRSDAAKLKIIVKNLVANAVKFTDHGRVTVSVRFDLAASQLDLVVADTGIGIPATELPHIFDMFRQARNVTVRQSGGVGLGLYIVKQFVELLEGVVEVQSRLGLGTTFRVRVPSATSKRQAA